MTRAAELMGLGVPSRLATEIDTDNDLANAPATRKYLLNWDSTLRNITTVKTNIKKYEQMPFDGMALDATFVHDQVSVAQPLSSWTFSNYAIDWPSLATSLSDLQTTPFRKFSQNFLMTKMTVVQPYAVADWYSEDFKAAVWNMRMAARFAYQGGLRGIFLDMEPDNHLSGRKLLNYSDRPYASTYSFDEYKTKVKYWASVIMQSMQEEYPHIHVVISFSYEQAIKQNNPPIETDNYGLFAPFLDGLFNAANSPVQIHNYYEDGYFHYLDADIAYDLAEQQSDHEPIKDTDRYFQHYKRGYASFVDGLGDTNLQEVIPKSVNEISQRYSWLYVQAAPFFGASGPPDATAATIAAVNAARVEVGFQRAFDPNAIPGLIANVNPFTMGFSNNDPIGLYTDSTDLIYTQSGGNRPLFKTSGIAANVPGIDFTAVSSQSLVMDGIISRLIGTSDIPHTIIACFKLKTTGANYVFFGLGRNATTNPEISVWNSSTNFIRWSIADDAAGNSTITGSVTGTDTNPHVGSWIYSGTVLNMRQDGANVITTNPYQTADYGVMTLNQARLGSNARNAPAFFANAVIGRFLVYDRPLGLDAVRWLELGIATEASIAVAGE